jgi:hypothetical protein
MLKYNPTTYNFLLMLLIFLLHYLNMHVTSCLAWCHMTLLVQ